MEIEIKEYLDREDFQRIIAYSECEDGTEVYSGNFGVASLNKVFGGKVLRIPNELFLDGKIIRNIDKIDLSRILRNHKNYISDLEIVSDVNIAERLARKYQELNNSFDVSCLPSTN